MKRPPTMILRFLSSTVGPFRWPSGVVLLSLLEDAVPMEKWNGAWGNVDPNLAEDESILWVVEKARGKE